MAARKSDAVMEAEEKVTPSAEEAPSVASFVTVFWDQYELRRERALKNRENREDAYLNAVKEVIKFNKQFRHSIAKLYEQSKKTNKELASDLMHQFKARKEELPVEMNEENEHVNDREELKKQLKEVTGQLEKLAFTPLKSVVQIIGQIEDQFEKNAESSIEFARERRNAWFEVRRGYVKLARNTHLDLVERGKDSIKAFVKAR